jgi:hypothetical protein
VWFHASFATADPEVLVIAAADKTHRRHVIIESPHANLKTSALAHLPAVHRERRRSTSPAPPPMVPSDLARQPQQSCVAR